MAFFSWLLANKRLQSLLRQSHNADAAHTTLLYIQSPSSTRPQLPFPAAGKGRSRRCELERGLAAGGKKRGAGRKCGGEEGL